MRLVRLLFILISPISTLAYAQLTDPHSATQILDQISKISESNFVCAPATAKNISHTKYTADSFSSIRCDDLFAWAPPEWIKKSKAVGIFKKPELWRPVCSWAQLDSIRNEHPKYSKTQLIQALNADTPRFDKCGMPSQKKSKTKASVKKTLPLPLSLDQKTRKLKDVEEIREKAAPACCGEDQECMDLIKNVRLGFCEKDPDSEDDDCLDSPTFYDANFENSRHWFKEAHEGDPEEVRKRSLGIFEIQSGTIIVSPFQDSGDDKVVYAHEFGHACSQLKRNLAIKRGSSAEFYEFIDKNECHISESSKTAYHTLVQDRGFNEETFSCLNQKATEVTRGKYHPTGCVEGCEHSYLEESYADLFSSTVSKDFEWVPDFIPEDMCNAVRDEEHMLASDIVGCMLKTPRVRTTLEKDTGCLK
jgi:hypothetical protein